MKALLRTVEHNLALMKGKQPRIHLPVHLCRLRARYYALATGSITVGDLDTT